MLNNMNSKTSRKVPLFLGLTLAIVSHAATLEWNVMDSEYWWAGLSTIGHEMPYDASSSVAYDMYGDNLGNQA